MERIEVYNLAKSGRVRPSKQDRQVGRGVREVTVFSRRDCDKVATANGKLGMTRVDDAATMLGRHKRVVIYWFTHYCQPLKRKAAGLTKIDGHDKSGPTMSCFGSQRPK